MNYTTWEQRVRKVEPYTPGEQPKTDNVIKLNTNENPFPPSPMVEKVIKEYNEDALRLYPDTRAGLLVDALAKRYGVDSDQVFVGVGSDDVISQTFLTFFNSDKEILFPDITYSFYDVWADLSESHMNVKLLMRISVSAKKITSEKTVELFFQIRMRRQGWNFRNRI